jgi:hypothetical protein
MKFNITVQALKAALQFAEDKGKQVVTLTISDKSGIGHVLLVSEEWDSKQEDITDYGSW